MSSESAPGPYDVSIDSHPELACAIFFTQFPVPIGSMGTPASWLDWLRLPHDDLPAPVRRTDEIKAAVRDVLRHGGYKPTGRGKPASEYLLRAAIPDGLRSINPAVDACNIVSMHSGLPISAIDVDAIDGDAIDRGRPGARLRIGIAEAGTEYVFNPAGQTIQLGGLLCLHDASGPCANAVKDSQRTKTSEATERTLSVLWGTQRHPEQTAAALDWYLRLLRDAGCDTETLLPR